MEFFSKLLSFFQDNQESQTVSNDPEAKIRDEGLANNSKMKEILDNPLQAIQNNEKLRNAVFAQQKQMGWNILPTTSEYVTKDNSTDLGLIKLNHKIRIQPLGNVTGLVNILMFGKSGCGQTTLLSYLTKNNQLKGVDSMSTQQFYAETIDIQSKSRMAKVRIYESPGMCSGFEIPQLEEHWNRLVKSVNEEGGVSIFLLLIKSNERIISQLIDELEEFSELYFEDKKEMWKRTVIVFTTIDELDGCSTFEERVTKLESQIAMRGMEKVKGIIDRTGNKCLYVSCIDQEDKYRLLFDLKDRIISIYRFNGFNGYLSETETESNTSIPYPKKSVELQDNHRECHQLSMSNHKKLFKGNNIVSLHPFTQSNRENSNVTSFEMKEFKSNHHDTDDDTSDLADRKMRANTISGIPNMDFGAEDDEFDHIQQLNREELIKLVQEMCQDKKGRKLCNKKFSKLFLTKEPPLKKGKKEKFQP